MKHTDLDAEYTPNAAARARAADRERLTRQREQATAREAEQRRRAALEARQQAAPIADQAELSAAIARLATGWGLKRKKGRRG